MTAPRFLVMPDELAGLGADDEVWLGGDEGHHAVSVRRLRVGEVVELTDGAGTVLRGEAVGVEPGRLRVRALRLDTYARPQPQVVVVQALAKTDRGENAVAAMTEVGVDGIIPWSASRSVVRLSGERAAQRVDRWRRTARESTKQARRHWLPDVAALATTDDVLARAARAELCLVLHEGAQARMSATTVPAAGEVLVVVGPEGGLTDEEVSSFVEVGAVSVRLGPTVLRSVTAGTAAAAVLMARTERW